MYIPHLITKKQRGETLSEKEIRYLIQGFCNGGVPDYQMSALLMAMYFQGVADEEGRLFLSAMIDSGERLSLSNVKGIKVDKHSTGGVGDKTSLIIAPIVAAAGVPVPMISGRALGHTGGTLDKLESIPGFRVELSEDEFRQILLQHNCVFGAQTDRLVPADRKLYALRDVTATVSIPPLIAASILSKKIAEGANALVMDVKVGNGGFLRSLEEAETLSKMLVEWSATENVETIVFGTDMSSPLGRASGNSPEVAECLEILKTGEGDQRLIELCAVLGGGMLFLGGVTKSVDEGKERFYDLLRSGIGYDKFREIAIAQGANADDLEHYHERAVASFSHEIKANSEGYITAIEPKAIGLGLVDLGAGRRKSSDAVDHSAGIVFQKQIGERVREGEVLAVAQWSEERESVQDGLDRMESAFSITDTKPQDKPLVQFYCDRNGLVPS
ncbi:thymidine phosphorylase [bacterium]|nr:thymidine phosphorylase [bacterium]